MHGIELEFVQKGRTGKPGSGVAHRETVAALRNGDADAEAGVKDRHQVSAASSTRKSCRASALADDRGRGDGAADGGESSGKDVRKSVRMRMRPQPRFA